MWAYKVVFLGTALDHNKHALNRKHLWHGVVQVVQVLLLLLLLVVLILMAMDSVHAN